MLKRALSRRRAVRGWTVCLLGFAFSLFGPLGVASAQWATSGNDIYSTNSGNVGIGTTSPDVKLHVNGNARASETTSVLDLLPFGQASKIANYYGDRPRGMTVDNATITLDTATYDGANVILDRLPSGKLILVYREGTQHGGGTAPTRYRTSNDEGQTWSSPATIVSEANISHYPGGGGVTPSGRIVLFYSRHNASDNSFVNMGHRISDDEGATWSSFIGIPGVTLTAAGPYGPVLPIGDGKLMHIWYEFTVGSTYKVHAIFSSDGGLTWGGDVTVISATSPRLVEPATVYLGGGKILMIARNEEQTTLYQLKSSDNGLTWTNQGIVPFDSGKFGVSPELVSVKNYDGTQLLVLYYGQRTDNVMRRIIGRAEDVFSSPSNWDTDSLTTVATHTNTDFGYPRAAFPDGGRRGIVAFFRGITSSDADITVASQNVPGGSVGSSFGIGTTSPKTTLHVLSSNPTAARIETSNTNTSVSGLALRRTANGATNNVFGLEYFFADAGGANRWIASVQGVLEDAAAGSYKGALRFLTANTASPAEAMRITSSGNVGIGTTTPTQLLHVKSGASDPAQIVIDAGTDAQLTFQEDSISKWAIYNEDTTDRLGIYDFGGTPGERLTILTSSGNVGIGTTNPTSRLHVVGDITATGAKNFQIAHPVEPDRKLLVHSVLEGPEIAVYYRGEAQLENGKGEIALPSYFESLTQKERRTVQLTPIDGWSPLYVVEGVQAGRFTVRTANGGNQSQRFYWEVKAVRADVPPLVAEKLRGAE